MPFISILISPSFLFSSRLFGSLELTEHAKRTVLCCKQTTQNSLSETSYTAYNLFDQLSRHQKNTSV